MKHTFEKSQFRQHLTLVVDLDERGAFKAHVENPNGKSIFHFSNEDEETGWPSECGISLVTDGFMRHGRDCGGLLKYLQSVGLAKPNATMSLCG